MTDSFKRVADRPEKKPLTRKFKTQKILCIDANLPKQSTQQLIRGVGEAKTGHKDQNKLVNKSADWFQTKDRFKIDSWRNRQKNN